MYRLFGLILLVSLAGCYVPLKWKAWRYDSDGLVTVPHWDLPFTDDSAARFTVGDMYVHAFLKAHDETTQGGGSPYQLIVVCYVPLGRASGVTFHSVEIVSSLDSRTWSRRPIEVDRRGEKIRSAGYPYTREFVAISKTAASASMRTDADLPLRPHLGESVTVRIAVSTGTSDGLVTYHFRPRLEEGHVGYIGPGD